MAIPASTFDDAPTERQPGQLRRSKQGTPYVVDPSGALVKDGARKGMPKLLPYGRPSGFGKQIEDDYALTKRSERFGVLGLGLDYADACAAMAQPELASACAALVTLDPDSREFRDAADAIITEAKRIAKADLAAERGTHAHKLFEEHDAGRDITWLFPAGEELGLSVAVQLALVDAWQAMKERDGLEILANEMIMVHDEFRLAGTLDRIVRLTKPLRFVLASGEIVELPAGMVLVLDAKTGRIQLEWWINYSVQIAAYAGGCHYDPDTDERAPYAWPVSQRWGLIAHAPVLEALAGNPVCNLVLVDIEAGREEGARLVLAAKVWGKRSDLFSTSQIVDVDLPQVADEPAGAGAAHPLAPAVASPAELHERLRRHPNIDEGTVDHPNGLDVAFAALRRWFEALEPVDRTWLSAIQTDAHRHGCGFHAHEGKTLRRFELIRGLVTLAARGDSDDELVRIMVHHITGDDVALFPSIVVGHVVGSLDATEAQQFAQLADALVAGSMALTFTDDGKPLLRALAAAS